MTGSRRSSEEIPSAFLKIKLSLKVLAGRALIFLVLNWEEQISKMPPFTGQAFVSAHLDGANLQKRQFARRNLPVVMLREIVDASCVGTNFSGANLGRDKSWRKLTAAGCRFDRRTPIMDGVQLVEPCAE